MGKKEKKRTLSGSKRLPYFHGGFKYIYVIWKIQEFWKTSIFEMQNLGKVYIATTLYLMNTACTGFF